MGEPEELPRVAKVRFGQADVKRAVAWIAMRHRNLRAMPYPATGISIRVTNPVAILQ